MPLNSRYDRRSDFFWSVGSHIAKGCFEIGIPEVSIDGAFVIGAKDLGLTKTASLDLGEVNLNPAVKSCPVGRGTPEHLAASSIALDDLKATWWEGEPMRNVGEPAGLSIDPRIFGGTSEHAWTNLGGAVNAEFDIATGRSPVPKEVTGATPEQFYEIETPPTCNGTSFNESESSTVTVKSFPGIEGFWESRGFEIPSAIGNMEKRDGNGAIAHIIESRNSPTSVPPIIGSIRCALFPPSAIAGEEGVTRGTWFHIPERSTAKVEICGKCVPTQ